MLFTSARDWPDAHVERLAALESHLRHVHRQRCHFCLRRAALSRRIVQRRRRRRVCRRGHGINKTRPCPGAEGRDEAAQDHGWRGGGEREGGGSGTGPVSHLRHFLPPLRRPTSMSAGHDQHGICHASLLHASRGLISSDRRPHSVDNFNQVQPDVSSSCKPKPGSRSLGLLPSRNRSDFRLTTSVVCERQSPECTLTICECRALFSCVK